MYQTFSPKPPQAAAGSTAEESPAYLTESSPLRPRLGRDDAQQPSLQLWKAEVATNLGFAAPLCLTMFLQYTLIASGTFAVAQLGKEELSAVSLANMTAIISGYAVYQGLATALDTLCPQAYGAGNSGLVGLHAQRVSLLLLVTTLPIGALWLSSPYVLKRILPQEEERIGILAGQYLRIALIGAPGYALFETGKRFLQAQGLFRASLYGLLLCAPLNALMSWFFVWKLNWGFLGAPVSVAITNNLLPLWQCLYVRFVAGKACWHRPSAKAFRNWRPMLRLALPGFLMLEAEFFAWELLTFISSYLGVVSLATQSGLSTIVSIIFQVSFSFAIAGSTRTSSMIGARRPRHAKVAAQASTCIALAVGCVNLSLLSSLRHVIPRAFSTEPEIVEMMSRLLPICAGMQVLDSLAACCNGILRAVGRQVVGSYVQLAAYYLVALPAGIAMAFCTDMGLQGLWVGMTVGLFIIAAAELVYLGFVVDWAAAIEDADARNEEL